MLGKHKFYLGQRVRPSKRGIERHIFVGTYQGVAHADVRSIRKDA